MTKMKPHISMILLYWAVMAVVLGLIVILVQPDPFGDIGALLIGLLVVLVMCFVFVMVFCNLPYIAVEIGELSVKGPSQWGAGLKKVVIPYTEFSHIVDQKIMRIFGLYYIKSTRGKVITVLGCRPDQYTQLLETINGKIEIINRKKMEASPAPAPAKKRVRRARVAASSPAQPEKATGLAGSAVEVEPDITAPGK